MEASIAFMLGCLFGAAVCWSLVRVAIKMIKEDIEEDKKTKKFAHERLSSDGPLGEFGIHFIYDSRALIHGYSYGVWDTTEDGFHTFYVGKGIWTKLPDGSSACVSEVTDVNGGKVIHKFKGSQWRICIY